MSHEETEPPTMDITMNIDPGETSDDYILYHRSDGLPDGSTEDVKQFYHRRVEE